MTIILPSSIPHSQAFALRHLGTAFGAWSGFRGPRFDLVATTVWTMSQLGRVAFINAVKNLLVCCPSHNINEFSAVAAGHGV